MPRIRLHRPFQIRYLTINSVESCNWDFIIPANVCFGWNLNLFLSWWGSVGLKKKKPSSLVSLGTFENCYIQEVYWIFLDSCLFLVVFYLSICILMVVAIMLLSALFFLLSCYLLIFRILDCFLWCCLIGFWCECVVYDACLFGVFAVDSCPRSPVCFGVDWD